MLRIAFIAFFALTVPATAQITGSLGPVSPMLKRNVTVASDIVRIGDLIDNAGTAANIPVFRSPDLGGTGIVPVSRVLEAARSHAVLGVDTDGISEVMVTHASRVIPVKTIEARVAQAIATHNGTVNAANLTLRFDREPRTLHVESTATAEFQVARLSYDTRSGYFEITLELPGSNIGRRLPLRYSGYAVETAETMMLARPLGRGEIIRRSDIVVERRPKAEAGSDSISDAEAAVGLSVRKTMRAGQILRQADLMRPELVQRNETVTLVFEVPGVTLTLRGKALESGAQGDLISVLNVQSKRNVQGTVTGFRTVTVAGMKPRIAANMISENEPATSHNPRFE
jgi:flagella basal body P-ring formation protein FlgA